MIHRSLVARAIIPHPKGPARGVLVVRRRSLKGQRPARFNLPGGRAGVKVVTDSSGNHSFYAEAAHETAKREVHEETGLRTGNLKELMHMNVTKKAPRGMQREHHIVFVGNSSRKPKPRNEIREVAYYHPKKRKLKLTPHAQKAINHFYSQLPKNKTKK